MDEPTVQQIEYTILGTAISRPACVGEVAAAVTPEDFGAAFTRQLFGAICDLHLRGAPIDRVTVLNEVGPDFDLAVDEVLRYQTDDVGYYCAMLRQCSRLQAIQGLAADLYTASTLEQAEPVLSKLNQIMVSRQRVQTLTAAEAARQFLQDMTNAEKPQYLTWGIPELDKTLFGELGDFVLLGGYASSGKTLLSLQFAAHWAKRYRVGYFSLESASRKLVNRLLSHLSQVPLRAIKQRTFCREEAQKLVQAAKVLNGLHIDFISANSMSVRDIQAKALSERYQIVIVDYLQLSAGTSRSRYEEVTAASIGLHNLAQSNSILVLALAQLARPEKTGGKAVPPSMSSFRESGQIEQDADIAMLLWPEDTNDNRSARNLKVAKNKEGEKAKLLLAFQGETQTLSPIQPSVGQQMRQVAKEIRAQQNLFRPVRSYEPSPFDQGGQTGQEVTAHG